MAKIGKLGPGAMAVGLALVLAAALLALVATPPADAAPRFKTVTRTFQNTGFVSIPSSGPATPYPGEEDLGGFKRGKTLDVNLTLEGFGHGSPSDVDVMLSHGGVDRTVMSDVGSGAAGNVTLKLDDEAAVSLPGSTQLSSGAFKLTNIGTGDFFAFPAPAPTGLAELSGFDGTDPNGPWRLWVMDDTAVSTGQLASGWSITIKARVRR
jgi:hypothetical protein